MTTAVFALLLQRAQDPEHADRAWGRMLTWTTASRPSVLNDQIETALRLTRPGAEAVELCEYDEVEVERAAQERAEAQALEKFKTRYRSRGKRP